MGKTVDEQARILYDAMQSVCRLETKCAIIATALRQAESSALERAAQEVERCGFLSAKESAEAIRFLKSPAAAPAAEGRKAGCQCVIGAVAASCVYATSDRPCECACHPPPSEPVAPAPDRLRWEAVDMSGASASAACYEIHDDRGDIVALCFQQEDAEHIATLHNTAIFGAASPVVQGKETRK